MFELSKVKQLRRRRCLFESGARKWLAWAVSADSRWIVSMRSTRPTAGYGRVTLKPQRGGVSHTRRRSGRAGRRQGQAGMHRPASSPTRHGPAWQMSASPSQDAVEHVQGNRAPRLPAGPHGGKEHPARHEDDDQGEGHQHWLISHKTIADLGHHGQLAELAGASGFKIADAPAYARPAAWT
jgi:hypothetical protein